MPVYSRVGGTWTECVPFARSGSQWSDDDDELYARDAGEWKLIYPEPGGGGGDGLFPVEDLATTSVTHIAATITWTNPTQPYVTPTAVQVRLAEFGGIWNEMTYPITTWSWLALNANTAYTAQVRLIRREDGVVTDTSTTESVAFTTSVAPIGEPAPDPGGTGGDTIIPIGGGGTDNPGPPGTVDGCWWEWVVQELSDNGYTWTDTALSGEDDGDTDEFEIDFSSITPGTIVRVCRREACDNVGSDGVADTFGDWECGLPFMAPVDWDLTCAGALDSENVTSLSASADAVFRYPQFCKEAAEPFDRLVMREAVMGYEVSRGPGWYAAFTDANGEQGVLPPESQTAYPIYNTMIAPVAQLSTMFVVGADWTLVSRFRALGSFSGSTGRMYATGVWGGIVSIFVTETATGWVPGAFVLTAGGIETLTGSEIDFDSARTHTLAVRWVDGGDLDLVVDGAIADTFDVSAVDLYETTTIAGLHASPAGIAVMQQLGWDRALSDAELEELADPWASATQFIFEYTGYIQNFTVPSGMSRMRVRCRGAGNGSVSRGGIIRGEFDVTPGTAYRVYVGGLGAVPTGGWPNGGQGGTANDAAAGGHGATYLTLTAGDPGSGITSAALIVAGAGGGGGDYFFGNPPGGFGGYPAGGDGTHGLGGTQSAGGASTGGSAGDTGGQGFGGSGPYSGASAVAEGGGGGGGWHGGGSAGNGSNGGSGGGGSSHVSGAGVMLDYENNAVNGNGQLMIEII